MKVIARISPASGTVVWGSVVGMVVVVASVTVVSGLGVVTGSVGSVVVEPEESLERDRSVLGVMFSVHLLELAEGVSVDGVVATGVRHPLALVHSPGEELHTVEVLEVGHGGGVPVGVVEGSVGGGPDPDTVIVIVPQAGPPVRQLERRVQGTSQVSDRPPGGSG